MSSVPHPDDNSLSSDDEDEEECRVCRGGAEEDEPLFSPCKCSGSIGLVHQDCLTEWLALKQSRVQKCELCSVPFQFAPKYADGTPNRLPFYEVVVGIIHRSFDKWLPFGGRILLSLMTWLFLLPLSTAYIYCGFIRGFSETAKRMFQYQHVLGDTMAGIIVATVIVVGFLSLMNFGDFLRLHWQQVNERRRNELRNNNNNGNDNQNNNNPNPRRREGILRRNNIMNNNIDNGAILPPRRRPPIPLGGGGGGGGLPPPQQQQQQQQPPLPVFEPPRQGQQGLNDNNNNNNRGMMIDRQEENIDNSHRRAAADGGGGGGGILGTVQEHNGGDGEEEQEGEEDTSHHSSSSSSDDFCDAEEGDDDDDDSTRKEDDDDIVAGHPAMAEAAAVPVVSLAQEPSPDQTVVALPHHHHDVPPPFTPPPVTDPERAAVRSQPQAQPEIPPERFTNHQRQQQQPQQEREAANDQEREDEEAIVLIPPPPPVPVPPRNHVLQPPMEQEEMHIQRLVAAAAAAEDRFEPRFEPVEPVIPPAAAPVGGANNNNNNAAVAQGGGGGFDFDIDEDDMDLQFDLEELLGLRGHVSSLFKKFLWLLTFNLVFLGLFTCIPHSLGWRVHEFLLRRRYIKQTTDYLLSKTTVGILIQSIIEKASEMSKMIQLPDFIALVLGYLSIAHLIVSIHWMVTFYQKYRHVIVTFFQRYCHWIPFLKKNEAAQQEQQRPQQVVPRPPQLAPFRHPALAALEEQQQQHRDDDATQPDESFNEKLLTVLECAAGISKVSVLLFLKMLVLPLFLGISLDVATIELFQSSVEERFLYFADDLFGSLLIHWVMGISFMLLVTVSVLQLREVVHPDLFAKTIRPQEPQPDLFQNLLQERSLAHAKRMLTSLAIYLGLLVMHIWIPAQICITTGLASKVLPFFRPIFNHFLLPQLFIPLEVLGFHFCMLALLEKHKNNIGKLQHQWLLFSCRVLGLTEYIIPRDIEKFVYMGARHVCVTTTGASSSKPLTENADASSSTASEQQQRTAGGGKVSFKGEIVLDPFWSELLEESFVPTDDCIMANLDMPFHFEDKHDGRHPIHEEGMTKENGQRHLVGSQSHLRFPDQHHTSVPTTLRPYRLRRRQLPSTSSSAEEGKSGSSYSIQHDTIIEFWKEVGGTPIQRPPDGWDDLGDGGAEVQGRWAWGDETKSKIEEGVAHCTSLKLRRGGQNTFILLLKLMCLVIASWAVTVCVCCLLLNIPIMLGRSLVRVLSLPNACMHDPINFVMGLVVMMITGSIVSNTNVLLSNNNNNGGEHAAGGGLGTTGLGRWIRQQTKLFFKAPAKKSRIVIITIMIWLFLCPYMIGSIYEACLMRSSHDWSMTSLSRGVTTTSLDDILQEQSFMKNSINVFMTFIATIEIGLRSWVADLIGLEVIVVNNQAAAQNNAAGGEQPQEQVVAAAEQPNNDEDNNQAHDVDGGVRSKSVQLTNWKGKDGRVKRLFTNVGRLVFPSSSQEWDQVNEEIYVKECTIPLVRSIGLILFSIMGLLCLVDTLDQYHFLVPQHGPFAFRPSPTTTTMVVSPILPLDVVASTVETNTTNYLTSDGAIASTTTDASTSTTMCAVMYIRFVTLLVIAIQWTYYFREPLKQWFEKAHKAARDERYLIGETLLNYKAD